MIVSARRSGFGAEEVLANRSTWTVMMLPGETANHSLSVPMEMRWESADTARKTGTIRHNVGIAKKLTTLQTANSPSYRLLTRRL